MGFDDSCGVRSQCPPITGSPGAAYLARAREAAVEKAKKNGAVLSDAVEAVYLDLDITKLGGGDKEP